MDYGNESIFHDKSGQTVIEIQANSDCWIPGVNDQGIWATDDDYGAWNGDQDTISNPNFSEPPQKRSRNPNTDPQNNGFIRDRNPNFSNNQGNNVAEFTSLNRSKVIGKMFFKTKLCCKFRAGTCPYITNCNFAHGIEELRKPPPNWQEIVAAQEDDRTQIIEREEHQIPSISSTGLGGESQRSYKGRHCKKFYTEEGCPYGDMCTFLHDEQSKARESVAISLGPTGNGGGYGGGGGNGSNQKPSNWKTRICNKWETTGYCPFGSKCHFAHGLGELHRYGGGLVEMEGRDSSTVPSDSKINTASSKVQTDAVTGSMASIPHMDTYHVGLQSQRSVSSLNQRQGLKPFQKWKGPDKISRIYGDWIDDNEWESSR
ncbi:hypothetical protein AMTRI_Chr13g115660 [Amborella trichopoda]|uniref:C3H1-type domain-containing protein n=1 Tax=Amborella trichopoda TaxID=13333 RepID=W1NZZ3_AMBTC|nr:zinc finger CCCH domain-containing protein 56 [Amborella trichopoda]ERN00260.1 hypothetical protein AMTR_s00111p00144160 [Amborella trichopoda]|eukprot:XP_020519258.1 zinc finger CCCH domain-containing protein 56 [Amborella trichopoda]